MNYRTSVLVTILAKGIALVVGIVSSIITARYLGPEGRGILAVLVAVQGLAIQFGSFQSIISGGSPPISRAKRSLQ